MADQAHFNSQWLFDDNDLDYSTPVLPDSFVDPASSQRRQGLPVVTNVDHPGRVAAQAQCQPYTIKWSLCTRKSKIHKLTQSAVQNIECYPSDFWDLNFKSKIDGIVKEKKMTETHEPDETQITVSITTRGVKDIPFRAEWPDVDWTEVDGQIDTWSDLVRSGGKLTVQVALILKETSQLVPARTGRRGHNATNTQLNERAAIHIDQDAIDEPPPWEQVYDIFECPGAGCDIGPYCFRHPSTGVRYPLPTRILNKIVDHAEKGGRIKEHSDVPKHIQNEIMSPPTKRKQNDSPQIHITNVIPGAEGAPPPKKLKIAGHRDKAIVRYRDWHCSQVDDPKWKMGIHAIADLTFQACLSLDRLFESQEEETKFFVANKIPRGIAHQWVGMVDKCKEILEE